MAIPSDKRLIALLIVNSPADRVFFKKTLSNEYFIIEARDGKEALEKIDSGRISVIITHDETEGMSCKNFCEKVRSHPSGKNIPLLVYTSRLKKSYVKELLTAGATDFLREPLDKIQVYKTISTAINAQRLKSKMSPLASTLTQSIPKSPSSLSSKTFSIRDLATRAIKKALDESQNLSLLLISVDHFPKILKRWGEEATKELFDEIHGHLSSVKRVQDTLFYVSKEKFLMILPKTSSRAAKLIAEDIKDSFSDKKFTTRKGSVKLTISLGLTSMDKKEHSHADAYKEFDALLKSGEEYLLKAKTIGDRIVSKDTTHEK